MPTEVRITEATRYLCARAQIDEKWCDSVLEEFLDNDFSAVGICYGVDLPTVLRSCLHAKERRKEKNSILAILYIVSIVFLITIFLSPLALVAYCTAWRILYSEQKKARHTIVAKYMQRGTFNPGSLFNFSIDASIESKLSEIASTQDANVLLYKGASPFIGAGRNIGIWSYSVDISNGKEDVGVRKKPMYFGVSELYEQITRSVNSLGFTNLVIEDYLCISGKEVRGEKKLLPKPVMRPITRVDDSFMKYFAEKPKRWARHYKCIRVSDWSGELVLSIFVRFSIVQKSLFIEANYFLLKPLDETFHQIDQLRSKPSANDRWRMALSTMFKSFSYGEEVIKSTIGAAADNRKKKREKKELEEEILYNGAFDYGAEASLRENASQQDNYSQYFQLLDKEMYLRSIERRLVNSIISFLDSKNIDTSELKEEKTTILNNGVIVSGGAFNANSLSVGENSKAGVFGINRAKNQEKGRSNIAA